MGTPAEDDRDLLEVTGAERSTLQTGPGIVHSHEQNRDTKNHTHRHDRRRQKVTTN